MVKIEDELDEAVARFLALIERVRRHSSLPCVCVPSEDPNEGATEESIAVCTPCHAENIFDESLELAEGAVRHIERLAAAHPDKPVRSSRKPKRNKVVRFQPLSTRRQRDAVWKY